MNDPLSVPPAVESALAALAPDERARLLRVWRFVQRNRTVPNDPRLDERKAATVVRDHLRLMAEAQKSALPDAVDRMSQDRPPRRSRRLPFGWGATIAVMLALIVAGGIWLSQPHSVVPPDGQTLRLTLPDGSRVVLNVNARLSYPRWYGLWNRTVALQGTAFFAVEHSGDPFMVSTSNARITVLGTRFEVQGGAAGDGATTITVEEGSVRLEATESKARGITLRAGQKSTLPAGTAVPTPPVSADVTADTWRLKVLSFVDQPLLQIVEALETHYKLEIRVEENALRERRRLTYIAQRPVPIDTVLGDLCRTLELQFRRTANGYEIFRVP